MSLSRRDVRRLSAGWEVVEDGPAVRVGRALAWLVTGRTSARKVTVVRAAAQRGSR
jgi:hypothetical protein